MVATSDPEFYHWTQWIFKQLYNDGLAKLVIEISQKEKSELNRIGQIGKAFYDEHFDKMKCLRKLDGIVGLN